MYPVWFLQKEDPAKNNPRFWDELFLMKVSVGEKQISINVCACMYEGLYAFTPGLFCFVPNQFPLGCFVLCAVHYCKAGHSTHPHMAFLTSLWHWLVTLCIVGQCHETTRCIVWLTWCSEEVKRLVSICPDQHICHMFYTTHIRSEIIRWWVKEWKRGSVEPSRVKTAIHLSCVIVQITCSHASKRTEPHLQSMWNHPKSSYDPFALVDVCNQFLPPHLKLYFALSHFILSILPSRFRLTWSIWRPSWRVWMGKRCSGFRTTLTLCSITASRLWEKSTRSKLSMHCRQVEIISTASPPPQSYRVQYSKAVLQIIHVLLPRVKETICELSFLYVSILPICSHHIRSC